MSLKEFIENYARTSERSLAEAVHAEIEALKNAMERHLKPLEDTFKLNFMALEDRIKELEKMLIMRPGTPVKVRFADGSTQVFPVNPTEGEVK